MRTLIHGGNKSSDGFVMLRDLLVMFVVIICFAAVMVSMAAAARQSSRLFENTLKEIDARNASATQRVFK